MATEKKSFDIDLFLISFFILFLEIALIRWLPSKVRAVSYFSNMVLLSSFLGLGLGCLIAHFRKNLLYLFPISLLLTVFMAFYFSYFIISNLSHKNSEHLWLLYTDLSSHAPRFPLIYTILIFFVGVTLVFVPIGQALGKYMKRFTALVGYSINIAGSLLGILFFALVSYLQLSPIYWFAIVTVIFLFLVRKQRNVFLLATIILLPVCFFIHRDKQHHIWSPYYAISVSDFKNLHFKPVYATPDKIEKHENPGFMLMVNGSFHQAAVNFSYANQKKYPEVHQLARAYSAPYRQLKIRPKRVLIIGAGTGNDVAIALANGVEEIDAVEIDPAIYQLGKKYHPNLPYNSPKVRVFITDARSFLQSTQKKYDMIIFATLDSQTLLSGLSSIRLDNYVYTTESLRQARQCLSKNGVLALYYWIGNSWIYARHFRMISSVFDNHFPYEIKNNKLFNRIFMAGPGLRNWPLKRFVKTKEEINALVLDTSPTPTDDWPFLYSPDASLSSFYKKILFAIILFAGITTFVISPATISRFSPPFFFLGAAFLLLETKGLTQMSLFFGATWWVNSLVFFSILSVVFLANYCILKKQKIPLNIILSGLIITLSISYFMPRTWILQQHLVLRICYSLVLVGMPVLFGSLLFSKFFAHSTNIDAALGSNLLGAVFGGLLEFTCIILGMKFLYIMAICFYLLAYISRKRI